MADSATAAATAAGTSAATESDSPEPLSGLQAIWANTAQPVAPLPWYRRLSPKAVIAVVAVVGLFTALTVAAVTGAGAPDPHRIVLTDRIGDQKRLLDDEVVNAIRRDFQPRLTGRNAFRDLSVAGYGAEGSPERDALVIGATGGFPDARTELDRVFGRPAASGSTRERQDFPAGPLGGALECGLYRSPAHGRLACAWADGTTLGIVVDESGKFSPQDLAKRTLEIRAAVEVDVQD